jgi:hypothetical protein
MTDPQPDHTQLLQSVLMRAAANRAAQISRQQSAALVQDIKAQQAKARREN